MLAASQADSWLLSLEQRQLLAPLVPLIPRHQWVQIDMLEVGLDFQEELGEVFGHLLADRVLEGAHVRPVQRLSVSREVPLDVAQFDLRPGVAHDTAKIPQQCAVVHNPEPGARV